MNNILNLCYREEKIAGKFPKGLKEASASGGTKNNLFPVIRARWWLKLECEKLEQSCDSTCAAPWNTKAASGPEWSPRCAWLGSEECWESQTAAEVGRWAVLQAWKAPAWGRRHSDSLQSKFKCYACERRKTLYSSSEEQCNCLGPHSQGNWQIEIHQGFEGTKYNEWIHTQVIWAILKRADKTIVKCFYSCLLNRQRPSN